MSLLLQSEGQSANWLICLSLEQSPPYPFLNPQQTPPVGSTADLLERHKDGEVWMTVTLEIRMCWLPSGPGLSQMFCLNSLLLQPYFFQPLCLALPKS